MAYDATLAARIRTVLTGRRAITERTMFGGIAFMVRGNMFVGIVGRSLMARVGPASYEAALREPYVRVMDFTGTPLRGYVYVGPRGIQSDHELARWVGRCLDHARTLPAKRSAKRQGRR